MQDRQKSYEYVSDSSGGESQEMPDITSSKGNLRFKGIEFLDYKVESLQQHIQNDYQIQKDSNELRMFITQINNDMEQPMSSLQSGIQKAKQMVQQFEESYKLQGELKLAQESFQNQIKLAPQLTILQNDLANYLKIVKEDEEIRIDLHEKIKICSQAIIENFKKLALKSMQPFRECDGEPQYEDLNSDDIDENYFEQDREPFFRSNIQPIASFLSVQSQSKIYTERQQSLKIDMDALLLKHKIDFSVQNAEKQVLIEKFLEAILLNDINLSDEKQKQPDTKNVYCQTDSLQNHLEMVDQLFQQQQIYNQELYSLNNTQNQIEPLKKMQKMLQKILDEEVLVSANRKHELDFYENAYNEIFDCSKQTMILLEQLTYSHEMMQVLVKDMNKDKFDDFDEYFDLAQAVYKAYNIVLKEANQKKIQLIAEVDNGSHMCLIKNLQGDMQRFIQILVNFMKNALVTIPQGKTIRVLIRMKDYVGKCETRYSFKRNSQKRSNQFQLGDEKFVDIQMKVIDTGHGYTDEQIKTCFNFEENTGLYNCKSLIEQMGGNITVETKLGQGTCFSCNFKTVSKVNSQDIGKNLRKKCKNEEIDNPLMPGFLDQRPNSHVFIVKQNKKQVIQTSLKISLGTVRQKELDKKEKESLNKIEQQILDIKQNLVFSQRNPQSHVEPQLFIPLKSSVPESIDDAHDPLVSSSSLEQSGQSSLSSCFAEGKVRVLLAHKSQQQLQIMISLFKAYGFAVQAAQNGFQVLQFVKQSIQNQELRGRRQNQLFNLILMDLDIPLSDGFETCSKIRNLYEDVRPVVYLSQQLFLDDQPVIQEMPLNQLKPVIVAWKSENAMENVQDNIFDFSVDFNVQKNHIDQLMMPQLVKRENLIEDEVEDAYLKEKLQNNSSSNSKQLSNNGQFINGIQSVRNSELVSNAGSDFNKSRLRRLQSKEAREIFQSQYHQKLENKPFKDIGSPTSRKSQEISKNLGEFFNNDSRASGQQEEQKSQQSFNRSKRLQERKNRRRQSAPRILSILYEEGSSEGGSRQHEEEKQQ